MIFILKKEKGIRIQMNSNKMFYNVLLKESNWLHRRRCLMI